MESSDEFSSDDSSHGSNQLQSTDASYFGLNEELTDCSDEDFIVFGEVSSSQHNLQPVVGALQSKIDHKDKKYKETRRFLFIQMKFCENMKLQEIIEQNVFNDDEEKNVENIQGISEWNVVFAQEDNSQRFEAAKYFHLWRWQS